MGSQKGIAIQLQSDLLKKLNKQNLPRNDVISKALEMYFNKGSSSLKMEKGKKLSKPTVENLYNEIYSNLYNTQIIPLKKELTQQQEVIDILKEENREYRQDKSFLKEHIARLVDRSPKKRSRFAKKRTEMEWELVPEDAPENIEES